MSYKPDEKEWMAYLYGELEGNEKEKVDQYLLSSQDARLEFERFQNLRKLMSTVEDKEVIAPPIIIEGNRQRWIWNSPAVRTILSIAASLLLIILVGKITGTRMSVSNNEFKLSFGTPEPVQRQEIKQQGAPGLSAEEVQNMINSSMQQNNIALQTDWSNTQQQMLDESRRKLQASIRENLAQTSTKIDEYLRTAAGASQSQIEAYVATMQAENSQRMKDYFELTASQQKKYIEDVVVDFAQYVQQQRKNDLQLVQDKIMNIEQNTTSFQQETEQILASIIGSVPSTESKETKN